MMKIKSIVTSVVLMLVAVVSQLVIVLSTLFVCVFMFKNFRQGLAYQAELYHAYFYVLLVLSWIMAAFFYYLFGYRVRLRSLHRRTVGTVISASIFMGIGLNVLITSALDMINLPYFVEVQGNKVYEFLTVGDFVLGFITVVFLGPVFEEVLFRKLICEELHKGGFSQKKVILIQAVLFAIYHFDLVQSSYAFIIGIVLGALTYYLKTLVPAILTHCIINGVAYFMARFKVEWFEQLNILSLLLGLGFVLLGSYEFSLLKRNKYFSSP